MKIFNEQQYERNQLNKRPKVVEKWNASEKYFYRETSLHGWKYLKLEENFFLKMVWIFVLASACVSSVFFMYYYTNQFLSATIVTSIDSTIAPIEVQCDFFFWQIFFEIIYNL